MNKHIKAIRRNSRLGLWGSVAAVILTVVFIYAVPYRFYPSANTSRWMLIAGVVLSVLAVSMTLLSVRRQIPRLRQTDDLEGKLGGYSVFIREVYFNMLAVVVIVCAFTLLSARNQLLMLAMVSALVLILCFPNMYKMKADLGLDDDMMRELFGDRYIGGDAQ